MATRLDNMGIFVEDLDAAIVFFTELSLSLDGRSEVSDRWAGQVTGLAISASRSR